MGFTYAGYFADAVLDAAGNVQPGASVLVKTALGGVTANLYTDRNKGTAAGNPITADSLGGISFYADPGLYLLVISSGALATSKIVTVAPYASEVIGVDEAPLSLKDPRVGGVVDGSTNDAGAWTTGLALVEAARNSGFGGELFLPKGVSITNSQIVVPNFTVVRGLNANASQIKAGPSFPTSTPVIRLGRGTGIVFGCRLEDLMVHCNDVAGSTGVYSTEAQERCGLRRCVIYGHRLYGVNMESGCQHTAIHDCEIQPSLSGSTVGARYNCSNSHTISDTTFAGANGGTHDDAVRNIQGSLAVIRCHVEGFTDGFQYDTSADGVIMSVLGHSSVANLVHLAGTSTTSCFDLVRAGGTNALVDDWAYLTLTDTVVRSYVQSTNYIGQTATLKIPAAGGEAKLKWLSNDVSASMINQFTLDSDGTTFFDWSLLGTLGDLIFRSTTGFTERVRFRNGGGITLGGSTGPLVHAGGGSPEGVITAPVGSLWLRTNGGAATTLYVKESGTGNTGWVAK